MERVKLEVVPILEAQGYDYLWRPSTGMEPPWYAWFIKRNQQGARTHHIHMIEPDFKMWERLLFRDYLIKFPQDAKRYGDLKIKLSKQYLHDRTAYTLGKPELVSELTRKAITYF